jgi:hypothetical protein
MNSTLVDRDLRAGSKRNRQRDHEPHAKLRETGPSAWALARAPGLASKVSNTGATGGEGCGLQHNPGVFATAPGRL